MMSILEISDIRTLDIIISILGYVVVMISLLLLHLFFFTLPKLIYFKWKKENKFSDSSANQENIKSVSGEEIAAIAMALNLFLEVHDEESGKLTINKVSKPYSPWSSKIYAVRNQFNRI